MTDLSCRWCGVPATAVRDIEPAQHAADGLLKKAALTVDVCDEHAAMIDREVSRRDLERTIRLAESALKRTLAHTANHQKHLRALENARVELAKLDQ